MTPLLNSKRLKKVSLLVAGCFFFNQVAWAETLPTVTPVREESRGEVAIPSNISSKAILPYVALATKTSTDLSLGFLGRSETLSRAIKTNITTGSDYSKRNGIVTLPAILPTKTAKSGEKERGTSTAGQQLSAAQNASSTPSENRVTATYTLDPASFSANQSYGANVLSPDWTNISGTIHLRRLPTFDEKYFEPINSDQFLLKSKTVSRDGEIDTWTFSGITYLRLTEDGTAIYFQHLYGRLMIGIVKNLKETQYGQDGDYFLLYENKNLVDLLGSGYGATQDEFFTFGVDGFDIYAKYKGKEITRFKEYRHMEEGVMALKANINAAHGFSKTTARFMKEQTLLSDVKNNVLDLRDFGLKSAHTSGSIQAGSNQLNLSAPAQYKKGDYIIVEIGGEAGAGVLGTVGVGGVWPAKYYENFSEMNQDLSQPENAFAWLKSDGLVYVKHGNNWERVYRPDISAHYGNNYYIGNPIPLALKAKILDVSVDGLTLTLDKSAVVNTANANVYFDNAFVIDKLTRSPTNDGEANFPHTTSGGYDLRQITPSNMTLKIPEGNYAVGEEIGIYHHDGWKLVGAGAEATRVFSPKGVRSASIVVVSSKRVEINNFHVQGNFLENGYGFAFPGYISSHGGDFTQDFIPGGTTEKFPPAILFDDGSDDGKASNMLITDPASAAVRSEYSNNVWVENVKAVRSIDKRDYIEGWLFFWADVQGGGCKDCVIDSKYLTQGLDVFKSTGVQVLGGEFKNAIMAFNRSGDFLVKDTKFTILADSQGPSKGFSERETIINVNANTGSDYSYELKGGTIQNVQMIQEGYVNSNNDTLFGINIGGKNPNIKVLGGTYKAPDYSSKSKLYGAVGLNASGENAFVDNFLVLGKAHPAAGEYKNINLWNAKAGSTLQNSAGSLFIQGPLKQINNRPSPDTNKPPVIETITNQIRTEGQLITTTISVTDPNNSANDTLNINQTLTYALDGTIPSGAQMDPVTGVFTWTPTEEQSSTTPYVITIKVTDSGTPALSATKTFNVTVNEVNVVPVITAIPDQIVKEGALLNVPVLVTDSDLPKQNLTYSLDAGVPAGLIIDSVTGIITWTPSYDQAQADAYIVGVNVTDGTDIVKTSVKILVQNENRAPVIAAISDQNIKDGALLTIPIIARDDDRQDTVAVTISVEGLVEGTLPAGMIFQNGILSWTPTRDQAKISPYRITVSATDGRAVSVVNFQINIEQTSLPPEIVPIQPELINEYETMTLQIQAESKNKIQAELRKNSPFAVQSASQISYELTYQLDPGAPQGAVIDSATGVFTWTPGEDEGPGAYPVTVRVTDNSVNPPLSSTITFDVTVKEVNAIPTVSAISDQTIAVGKTLTIDAPTVADVDLPKQTITYSLGEGAPAGVSVDSAIGVISWTPTKEQVRTDLYTINLLVHDGMDTVSVPVKISVTNPPVVANAPIMISAGLVPGVGFQLSWKGEPNEIYIIESTTNFVNWNQDKEVVSNQEGVVSFVDVSGLPLRFYRLVKA